MDYIEELQAALLNLHGVSSTYFESVPVLEEFNGETVWQGEVEVFDIRGHPKAKRAYAQKGRHPLTNDALSPEGDCFTRHIQFLWWLPKRRDRSIQSHLRLERRILLRSHCAYDTRSGGR